MYPNQPQQGNQPQQPPQQPQPQQGYPQQTNGGYGPQPQQTYEIDYLEKIAPAQAPPKFFSGSFGKIIAVLIVLFVLAISLMASLGGKTSNSATTEQLQVRLENTQRIATNFQNRIKSGALSENNSRWRLWMANTKGGATDLLDRAGVKKSTYDRKMTAAEKQYSAELTKELEEAYLTGTFDRVYARKMAANSSEISAVLQTMAKRGPGAQLKEFAATANSNLKTINTSFIEFDETKD